MTQFMSFIFQKSVVQMLIQHDLVDELRLMIYPVVLGVGKRLFNGSGDRKVLELIENKLLSSGIFVLTCRPEK